MAAPSSPLFIESGAPSVPASLRVACKRVGIESAGPEWASKPLRFYEISSDCVSVRDKKAEQGMLRPG